MAEEAPITRVTVRLGAKLVENFNSKTIEIEVTDHVRSNVDKSVAGAIDRVYKLVESQVEKKLSEDE